MKKVIFCLAIMLSLLTTPSVFASEGKNQIKDEQEQLQWDVAHRVGVTKEQFEHIMNIPIQKVTVPKNYREYMTSQQAAVVNEAKKYIGYPYVWGGNSPATGFDCSGLVQYVYQQAVNISLPRITTQQETCGKSVSLNDLKPGDLLFWGPVGNTYHVALYIGDGKYIQAPKPGENVQYGSISGWTPDFARRILPDTPENIKHECDKYAVITKEGYTIWGDLNFNQKKGTTDGKLNQMYHVKRYYEHSNGNRYASLYDKNDEWIGYVNEAALKYTDSFGEAIAYDKYVTIMKKGYGIFQDKYFKDKVNTSDALMNQTYRVKRYYNLFNGDTYYSLYDNKDNWVGYINKNAVSLGLDDGNSKAGHAITDGQLVRIEKENYNMWNDFTFGPVRNTTTDNMGKVFKSKCYYNHFNGSCYLSLYNGKDQWMGYLNKDAASYTESMFENYITFNKNVKITKSGYGIFQDKVFKKKVNTSDNLLNKTYLAKGYYDLYDGTRYYSLYDGDTWIGYIRSTAVTVLDE